MLTSAQRPKRIPIFSGYTQLSQNLRGDFTSCPAPFLVLHYLSPEHEDHGLQVFVAHSDGAELGWLLNGCGYGMSLAQLKAHNWHPKG